MRLWLKFIGTRYRRRTAVSGCLVVPMEPNWFHWDQPPALEWPLRRPVGTNEFQETVLAASAQIRTKKEQFFQTVLSSGSG